MQEGKTQKRKKIKETAVLTFPVSQKRLESLFEKAEKNTGNESEQRYNRVIVEPRKRVTQTKLS